MDVLTHHNDINRTGTYSAETVLTPDTVRAGGFKKVFERNVSGDVYAQALYVRRVRVGAVVRNLCFVATSTNHVYAFDADDHNTNANTPAVWSRQLDPSRILTGNEICGETLGSVGITSTPVIDAQSKTMFVVTRFSSPSPGGSGDGDNYLHALDIATGAGQTARQSVSPDRPPERVRRLAPGLFSTPGASGIGRPYCC